MAASKQSGHSAEARVNGNIRAEQVRLIGESGQQLGIMSADGALAKAQEQGFDLVQVSADGTDPLVCKLMDYGKHLFDIKKQKAAARKKQHRVQMKEIKFRPGTGEGDYQIKLRKLKELLGHGDKTKVTMRYRGREMLHQELGVEVLRRVQKDLSEISRLEQEPNLEGRQASMVLAPISRHELDGP